MAQEQPNNVSEQSPQAAEDSSAVSASSEGVAVVRSTDKTLLISEIPEEEPKKRERETRSWSNLSYMTRVTMSFAAIAAMTLLVAVGVLSVVWGQHFNSYARENARATADAAAVRIAQAYVDEGNRWTPDVTVAASYVSATYPGVGVVVTDSKGVVRYDSSLGADVGSEMDGVLSLAPQSSSLAAVAYITVDGLPIGTVRIWSFGTDSFLRKSDEVFRDNSYEAMALASIIAIALATIIGFVFARNLVSPIHTISKTAKAVKEGDLSARTGLTGEDEIARLGETFDAMAEAIETDRELEHRLTTDVAHELRTPLMAIQATVEAMIDGVYKPSEDRLNQVNSEVKRLSRLVDALLRLARLENRANPMKEEVIDVGELVTSIVNTHEAFVNDSGLTLKYEMQKNVLIKGDADMIRQATANLISNAVRYTPEGGTVTVRVKHGELMADIVVEDTGIGLSPEEARMVFSRFWRADAGRNRATGGLGVGLAVVKEIVDRHHGWVQVEGKKGEGARFTIRIPLYKPEEEEPKGKNKNKSKGFGKNQGKAKK
ncbi:MAG: HAMP domain-containing sensor histidine kinase [Eggerthellales bacterium]|nr:HAMP domain-containing sensor histidine kinase [Eggerthellales bacterium]